VIADSDMDNPTRADMAQWTGCTIEYLRQRPPVERAAKHRDELLILDAGEVVHQCRIYPGPRDDLADSHT
jgi:hypothetical protein